MRLAVFALCAALVGCAPQTLQSTPTQSYLVGQRIQAAPGATILSSQKKHGVRGSVPDIRVEDSLPPPPPRR